MPTTYDSNLSTKGETPVGDVPAYGNIESPPEWTRGHDPVADYAQSDTHTLSEPPPYSSATSQDASSNSQPEPSTSIPSANRRSTSSSVDSGRSFLSKLKQATIGTKESRDAARVKWDAERRISEEEKRRAYEARLRVMEAKRDAEGEDAINVVANELGRWATTRQPLEIYKRPGKSGRGDQEEDASADSSKPVFIMVDYPPKSGDNIVDAAPIYDESEEFVREPELNDRQYQLQGAVRDDFPSWRESSSDPEALSADPPAYSPPRADDGNINHQVEDAQPSSCSVQSTSGPSSGHPSKNKHGLLNKFKIAAIGTKESRDADRSRRAANQRVSGEEKERAYQARLKVMQAKRDAEAEDALEIVANIQGWATTQTPLETYRRPGIHRGGDHDK